MHRTYHIHKEGSGNLLAVVYSLSYDSPMNHLPSIELELEQNGTKGDVFFDLLLSNGNTSDRFYQAFFDGKRLVETTIKQVSNPSETIQAKALDFYHQRIKHLNTSVLTKTQKFLIKKKQLLRQPVKKK